MTNYDVNQYAAEKTYNNQLPKQGEVIAPFVVTWEQVQYEHMDTRNLKTWTLRGGRKVLVAFTTVEAEKFNDMMRIFNFMADGHVRVDDKMNNLSLDEMQENPTAKYKEPAGISSAEEDYFAFIEMTGLINEVAEKDAESGACNERHPQSQYAIAYKRAVTGFLSGRCPIFLLFCPSPHLIRTYCPLSRKSNNLSAKRLLP